MDKVLEIETKTAPLASWPGKGFQPLINVVIGPLCEFETIRKYCLGGFRLTALSGPLGLFYSSLAAAVRARPWPLLRGPLTTKQRRYPGITNYEHA